MEHEGAMLDGRAMLGQISAPVLVLYRADSEPSLTASAGHVPNHVPNARLQEMPRGQAVPLLLASGRTNTCVRGRR